MNHNSEYKVCEKCYSVFNDLLENLADSLSEQGLKTGVQHLQGEAPVRKSIEDFKQQNKTFNKFLKKIQSDLEYNRINSVKDQIDVLLSDETDSLEGKFVKMKRLLDAGSLANSYKFGQDKFKEEKKFEENQSTIENLISGIGDDSGIADEYPDQLRHIESKQLMELAPNKYAINFKVSTEFKSTKYIDDKPKNVQTQPAERDRPRTANRKPSEKGRGSRLANKPNFKRDKKGM